MGKPGIPNCLVNLAGGRPFMKTLIGMVENNMKIAAKDG